MSEASIRQKGAAMTKIALGGIVLGAGLSLAALFVNRDAFGFAYLWIFAFVWAVVLGSLFFVGLHHVTRAVWSVVFRRVAEMLAAPVWVVGLLFIPVLLFVILHGQFNLFPWADPVVVRGDHVLEGKEPYLNKTFFALRALLFFLIWIGFAWFFLRRSLQQDTGEAGEEATLSMRKWSAPFMLIFALTMTFASFDWLMSLEPHWFSTIFGVYVFSGMVIASLSAIILAAVWIRAKGGLGDGLVTGEHLYSLGGLLFAFTCFWTYIAFSQFMLIWYGNIPEEAIYFVHRAEHGWLSVSLLVVVLRFVLPFFLLLSRGAKMNSRRLVLVAVIGLVGELVDLYWLIMPQYHREGPWLGWEVLGPALLIAGVVLFAVSRFLSRHGTLAANDPFFEKCCRFHL